MNKDQVEKDIQELENAKTYIEESSWVGYTDGLRTAVEDAKAALIKAEDDETLSYVERINAGYGPVCYKKEFGKALTARRKKKEDNVEIMPDIQIPGQMELSDYIKYP